MCAEKICVEKCVQKKVYRISKALFTRIFFRKFGKQTKRNKPISQNQIFAEKFYFRNFLRTLKCKFQKVLIFASILTVLGTIFQQFFLRRNYWKTVFSMCNFLQNIYIFVEVVQQTCANCGLIVPEKYVFYLLVRGRSP